MEWRNEGGGWVLKVNQKYERDGFYGERVVGGGWKTNRFFGQMKGNHDDTRVLEENRSVFTEEPRSIPGHETRHHTQRQDEFNQYLRG